MTSIDFAPKGVCARNIHVELSDDGATIEQVAFEGGCNGNLKAISKLVAGQPVQTVAQLLAGNTCGKRSTSCADQLSQALLAAVQNAQSQPAQA